jgi:hypothetical protein
MHIKETGGPMGESLDTQILPDGCFTERSGQCALTGSIKVRLGKETLNPWINQQDTIQDSQLLQTQQGLAHDGLDLNMDNCQFARFSSKNTTSNRILWCEMKIWCATKSMRNPYQGNRWSSV